MPVVSGLIWQLNSFLFFLFIAIVILRVQYEYALLFFPKSEKGQIAFGLALGFCLLTVFYFRLPLLPGLFGLLMILLLHALSTFREIEKTLSNTAVLFFGIAYIAGLLGHLILIRQHVLGRELIFFILIMTWGGDAGAYYVGKTIGRHKLAPRVSPNKTVEGALGGLLASFFGGAAAKLSFLSLFSWGELIVLSFLLGVFGQLGDLAESMMKRSAGVKDSSAMIPAHGGLFDKLDSLAFAAPLLYYYLVFFKS